MAYTNQTFLNAIENAVVEDAKTSGILASITAAQALIESGSGNSALTKQANNLFGIKGEYNGQFIYMNTKEWSPAKGYYTVKAKWRKYPSWKESIQDHSRFLHVNSRYRNLIGVKDYREQAKLLQADGYATSPTYAQTLINTIERLGLQTWDSPHEQKRVNTTGYPVIREGCRSEWVRLAQNALIVRGFPVGVCGADGVFGNDTKRATMEFQKWAFPGQENEWDGVIGQNTWNALFNK